MRGNHLGKPCIYEVVNMLYAMGRTIEEQLGVKQNYKKQKKDKNGENRRVRKLKKQKKEVRRIITWPSNKIYRINFKRKARKKVKKILEELQKKQRVS